MGDVCLVALNRLKTAFEPTGPNHTRRPVIRYLPISANHLLEIARSCGLKALEWRIPGKKRCFGPGFSESPSCEFPSCTMIQRNPGVKPEFLPPIFSTGTLPEFLSPPGAILSAGFPKNATRTNKEKGGRLGAPGGP